MLADVEAETLGDRLSNALAEAVLNTLADMLAEVEAEILGDRLGDALVEALVDTLADTLKEVEAATLFFFFFFLLNFFIELKTSFTMLVKNKH